MAGKSLGTLTIDLIARVGGFVAGMDQAERASDKWRKKVEENTKLVGTAIAGVAAAAVSAAAAVGVAGFNLLKTQSQQIAETDRWAKSLNMSTQSLISWQYAAEKAGVSGEQMADIFKDIGDKIGDAVLNQSGEAVDALNALGLSAKKLSSESPDKQLLAISDALEKINTNAEKTTILESLGNDLSKLLPLFDQGSEKLKQYLQAAKDFGVAPDDSDIDKLVKVNALFEEMEAQATGFKRSIAVALAEVDLTPLTTSMEDFKKTITDPAILDGLTKIVSGVVTLTGEIIKATSEFANFVGFIGQASDRFKAGGWANYNLQQGLSQRAGTLLSDISAITNPVKQDINVASFALPVGENNSKKPLDTGAKKLDSAFKSLEQSYKRQIALIDTTGKKNQEVTEIEKLRFDFTTDKLSGINAAQKEHLEQLATEVDRLKAIKKANEENLKLAEFTSNLQKKNANDKAANDSDFIGAGAGDRARQRMKELTEIQRGFLEQQADLQKQYQGGDISKSLYDQETNALQQALNDRLEIQEDYYKKSDAQMDDWQSGIMDALNDYADNSADYYQTAADAMTSILGGATSAISDNLNDLVHGAEDLGDFFSNIFASLGETIIKTLSDMAAQWLVYQGVQLLVGKSTQASAAASMIANAQASSLQAQIAAYASTAAIPIVGPALAPAAMATAAAVTTPLVAAVGTSALAGMAHDGIDSVPETGTWLLQKGERVVTSQTSAKLDETLDRVNQQSTQGANFSPVINMNVNGDPSDTQIAMMKQATADGAKLGYQQAASDLASGKGNISKAMMRWNTNRRTG